jgi:hypothetical protein
MKAFLNLKAAMVVHRRILKKDKLVYLLAAPKPQKYPHARSRVFYIGTTQKGADRIAASVAYRAQEVLAERGVKSMSAYMVSCTSVPGFKSWAFLEKALLAAFKLRYGRLPFCNEIGKKLRWNEDFERRIKLRALNKVLDAFEHHESGAR